MPASSRDASGPDGWAVGARRGRIVNAEGIVLSRADWGESDRLATVYTESLGKLGVRFAGVNKPRGKLKCLSEPLLRAEFRLHLGSSSGPAKAVGGRIIDCFPAVRSDYHRTMEALSLAEMLLRLTPDLSPNAAKYGLIVAALECLGTAAPGARRWVVPAFGLRLLELVGVGMLESPPEGLDPAVWEAAHRWPFDRLAALPLEAGTAGRLRGVVHEQIKAQCGREVNALAFLETQERVPHPLLDPPVLDPPLRGRVE
ncbi:MAG: DNA repair protein RecO [Elusimicrobia bacterium]|nr:DNA repair protein RecO [Elusimicrobiota bacterium]